MTVHNSFVSLETGSPAYTRTYLAENKCCQHDYSGSSNHAGTPSICHKDMGHDYDHLIISDSRIIIT